MDQKTAEKCRALVYAAAKRHRIPPVYVTAHVRMPAADEARKEVWRVMIVQMGLGRRVVAEMFGRDRRRLRQSVIGV